MRVLFRRGKLQRTLVVCPASMTNTGREKLGWELRAVRVQASARPELWRSPSEIYIVSYETLARDSTDLSPSK